MALSEAERAASRQRRDAQRQQRQYNVPAAEPLGPADDAYWNDLRDLDGTPYDPAPARAEAEAAARRQRQGQGTSASQPSASATSESEDEKDARALRRSRQEAAQNLWGDLPPDLFTVLEQTWVDTGSLDQAFAAMRRHPNYDVYYPGNLLDPRAGTVKFQEREYKAQWVAYEDVISDFGLDPRRYTDRIARLFRGNKSPIELRDDLTVRAEYVRQSSDMARDWLARNHGIEPTLPQMLDSLLLQEPLMPENEYRRALQASFVGGSAAEFGFDRSRERVDELMRAGLDTADESRQFYSQAAQLAPHLDVLGRRYHDAQLGVSGLEEAVVFGRPEQQRAMERLTRRNQSAFSPGGTVASRDGRSTGYRPS